MKKYFLLVLVIILFSTSYSYVGVQKANITTYQYSEEDQAYFHSKYEMKFLLINTGNWITNVTNFRISGFQIPFVCDENPPPIKPGYVLEYKCTSDIISCGDVDSFSYTPALTYILHETSNGTVTEDLTLPTRYVEVVSPVELVMSNKSLNESFQFGLDKEIRADIFVKNKGTESLDLKFRIRVPSYMLLTIYTDEGTFEPDEFEDEEFHLEGKSQMRIALEVLPRLTGGGEILRIDAYDKNDDCASAYILWDALAYSQFGRFIRILSDLDIYAIIFILLIGVFIIMKDKFFK